jgi:hypothetical protein
MKEEVHQLVVAERRPRLGGLMHAEAPRSGIGVYRDLSGVRSNELLHSKNTSSRFPLVSNTNGGKRQGQNLT